jgi:hypothetical protein
VTFIVRKAGGCFLPYSGDQGVLQCVSDYKKCADNGEVALRHESKDHTLIRDECKNEAKRVANGTLEFPSEPFSGHRLGRSYITSGTAVLIADDVLLKNINGSEPVVVTCFYDLNGDQMRIAIASK